MLSRNYMPSPIFKMVSINYISMSKERIIRYLQLLFDINVLGRQSLDVWPFLELQWAVERGPAAIPFGLAPIAILIGRGVGAS